MRQQSEGIADTMLRAVSASVVVGSLGLCLGLAGCARRLPDIPVCNADQVAALRKSLTTAGAGDAGAGAAEVATGTGWATLKGSFKLAPGEPIPERKPLQVNKEREVCAPGDKPVLDDVLLVDSASRGIANIVLFLRKANRVHDSAKPREEEIKFDQKNCLFLTHVQPVIVGETLTILNSDPIGHNTNIAAKKGVGANPLIPGNSQTTFKPSAEESAPIGVSCSIHPWMSAYMLPRSNGYMAVTKADGTFEIPNLPAGEDLEFQVWHESAPGTNVVASVADLKWDKKGRFKIKLQENEEKVLDVVVPSTALGR